MQLKYVKDLLIFWAHNYQGLQLRLANSKSKAEMIRKYLLGGSYNHKYTLMVCCGNIFLPVLDLLLLSVTQYICFNNVANTCMLLI